MCSLCYFEWHPMWYFFLRLCVCDLFNPGFLFCMWSASLTFRSFMFVALSTTLRLLQLISCGFLYNRMCSASAAFLVVTGWDCIPVALLLALQLLWGSLQHTHIRMFHSRCSAFVCLWQTIFCWVHGSRCVCCPKSTFDPCCLSYSSHFLAQAFDKWNARIDHLFCFFIIFGSFTPVCFLIYRLIVLFTKKYLYEIWHTCSSCSWLQKVASNFYFCLGT